MVEFADSDELLIREQFYINTLDVIKNGYNIAPKAGNTLGVPCSEETKKKIGASNKGRVVSEETKQKLKGKNLGNKFAYNARGIKRTEETKRKMSEAQKGNKKGIGNKSNTGKTISDEVKLKISNSLKGRICSSETKLKMKQFHKLNAANKKNAILLTYENKIMTLKQWSEQTGIPYKTIYNRYKDGLQPHEILSKQKLISRGENGQLRKYKKIC